MADEDLVIENEDTESEVSVEVEEQEASDDAVVEVTGQEAATEDEFEKASNATQKRRGFAVRRTSSTGVHGVKI